MLIITMCDLQVQTFPVVYQISHNLKFCNLYMFKVSRFGDGIVSAVGVSDLSSNRNLPSSSQDPFPKCFKPSKNLNICNLYILMGLRFELVCVKLRVFNHVYIQILTPIHDISNDVSYVGLSEIFQPLLF